MCPFMGLCFVEILISDLKGKRNAIYSCWLLLESTYGRVYVCDEYLLITCG